MRQPSKLNRLSQHLPMIGIIWFVSGCGSSQDTGTQGDTPGESAPGQAQPSDSNAAANNFSYPVDYLDLESFDALKEAFEYGVDAGLAATIKTDFLRWEGAYVSAFQVAIIRQTILDETVRAETELLAGGKICEKGGVQKMQGGAEFSQWTWDMFVGVTNCTSRQFDEIDNGLYDGSVNVSLSDEESDLAATLYGHSQPATDTLSFFFHNMNAYEFDGAQAYKGDIHYNMKLTEETTAKEISISQLESYDVSGDTFSAIEPDSDPVTFRSVSYASTDAEFETEYTRTWSEHVWEDGSRSDFVLNVRAKVDDDAETGTYAFDLIVADHKELNVKANIEVLRSGYKITYSRNGDAETGSFDF